MGAHEAAARSAVEDTLERAISAGELVVGGRGWRASQAQVVAAGLDADHRVLPGQSWRTAVITERLEQWVAAAQRRSEQLGAARAAVANRLLHPVEPPSGAADALRPAMWLLAQFGEEQALTAAGYLTQSFVRAVQHERPWSYSIEPDRPPRSETDDVVLLELREWLQQAGALRKRKGTLRRTAAGAEMAVDHSKAWDRLTRHLVPSGWDGFVCETALLHLVNSADEMLHDGAVRPCGIGSCGHGLVSDERWGTLRAVDPRCVVGAWGHVGRVASVRPGDRTRSVAQPASRADPDRCHSGAHVLAPCRGGSTRLAVVSGPAAGNPGTLEAPRRLSTCGGGGQCHEDPKAVRGDQLLEAG